jgi:O-antigen ligase
MPGASVVELPSGLRILRAYGTLPHPNILGGLVLVTLLGPTTLFLSGKKPNYATLILLSLGLILLVLTFSRSAWVGLVVFVAILVVKSKHLDSRKLLLLISTIAVTLILAFFPLRDFFLTRVADQAVPTEQISKVGRTWLMQQALHMFQKSPVIGIGVGSFILELANTAVEGAPIEPVHNILLLITSELGIVGLLLFFAVCISIALTIVNSRSPSAILASALLAGLGTISFFDHYLWTLAPGRVLLGFVLGLWAGQIKYDA